MGEGSSATGSDLLNGSSVLNYSASSSALRRRIGGHKPFSIAQYTKDAKDRLVITAGRHSSPSVPLGTQISRSASSFI